MTEVIAIDPGISKCGIVIADLERKIVNEAIVIKSDMLVKYIKKINQREEILQFLIGNGTSSKKHINDLREFISNLIIVEERNSTWRARDRYFEIFPIKGVKSLFPRDIFIINKNLDALAALILLEDYFKFKFNLSESISSKTWLK